MATAELLPPETSATNDIVVAVTQNPGLVLLDQQKFDAFYTRMKAETDKLVADTSTAKGRDEIRAMAAKVVRSKTAIDKARLTLTADWREKVKAANDAGKVIEERLTALAAEVRAPLTEWEEAEKARIERGNALIAQLKNAATVTLDDTAATVRARGNEVFNTAINADDIGDDLFAEASAVKGATIQALSTALARLTREEAERAELERLRAEAAARAEADRLADEAAARAQAEKEAAERAAAEAEAHAKAEEERRAAAEKAEAERIERAKAEAAAAERARVEREHAEQLAAERRRAEDAERAAQAERDRIAREEAARAAETRRIADEQAKRQADQEHRTAVKSRAKAAIMSCGVDEDTAKKLVLAIIAGEIPAVRLEF